MNRALQTSLVVVAALLAFVAGCAKQDKDKDKAISVQKSDPEMVAAIAKAKETLPHFWQVFEKRKRGDSDFALKVKSRTGTRSSISG